jgi:type II secretory pathway component HofQ
MNAIVVDNRNKEIFIGDMPHVISRHSKNQSKTDVEVYRNQSLLDLNRIVTILECFYANYQVNVVHVDTTV